MKSVFKATIKYICLLLSFVMCLNLMGCSKSDTQNKKEDKLKVVSAIFPAFDFARQIFGDRADITLLLPPGAESHNYEPSPKDIIKIQNCDLFIYNGGVSDGWVEKILDSMEKKPYTLEMMESSTLIDGADHHDHNHDEHVWMSIKNAISITKTITDTANLIDGENKDYYLANYESYSSKLSKLDENFKNLSNGASNKTLVFADRFPAKYFTHFYGFDYISAYDGCADKAEPGSAKISKLIEDVKKNKIPVVFYIEFSNQKVADTVCDATGAKKMLFHSCHNVTKEEFERGITYLELMEQNLHTVEEALG